MAEVRSVRAVGIDHGKADATFELQASGGTTRPPEDTHGRRGPWQVTAHPTPVGLLPTPYTPHPTPAGPGTNWMGAVNHQSAPSNYPFDPWTTQVLSLHPTPVHHEFTTIYRPADLTSAEGNERMRGGDLERGYGNFQNEEKISLYDENHNIFDEEGEIGGIAYNAPGVTRNPKEIK